MIAQALQHTILAPFHPQPNQPKAMTVGTSAVVRNV